MQGLAAGLKVPNGGYVRSPSFTLINEYFGKMPLYHFDFYRLDRSGEVEDLGLEEYFDDEGVSVVEWADKFPGTLPERTIHIKFRIIDEQKREIHLEDFRT